MMRTRVAIVCVIALALAACGGATTPEPTVVPQTTSAPTATAVAAATFAVLSPADGTTVSVGLVTVTGQAPAGAQVVQDINLTPAQEATTGADGHWSLPVKLDEGTNELTFRVGDDETTATTIRVTYVQEAQATAEPTTEPTAKPTEEPVVEPTVEPTEEPVVKTPEPDPFYFKTFILKGHGNKIVKFKIPDGVPAIASIVGKGRSNFIVRAYGTDGQNDLLVNEIGNYQGTVMFDTRAVEHSIAFRIDSSGSWTIKVKPITTATKWNVTSVARGKSSNVLWLTGDVSVPFSAKFVHEGHSNFAVWAWIADDRDLLINEVGRYTGVAFLPGGTTLLEVKADGAWTITPTH